MTRTRAPPRPWRPSCARSLAACGTRAVTGAGTGS
jgi:hypothetical protein